MLNYEEQYSNLVGKILLEGDRKEGRNGFTRSIMGEQIKVDLRDGFPILNGRQLYPKGVFGELAAMLRQPKHIEDFEKWGCNYWKKWAKPDGSIDVDYGNAWFDFNGVNQIAALKTALEHNPNDRRMIINGWDPAHVLLDQLDLPCCHYAYQFYVDGNKGLHMIWIQRSVDTMIGLPSDAIFAAAWLIAIARQFGLITRTITFQLGDCHIYEEHEAGALEYIRRSMHARTMDSPTYVYTGQPGKDFCEFEPDQLSLLGYCPLKPINFELKA